MDLRSWVGQLVIVGIPGLELTREVVRRLLRWRPGGIILFARNLRDARQARKLVADLNKLLSTPQWPLWVCVDQEGGAVARLTRGVSVFPGNMALGAAGNAQLAYDMGRQTAREWGALGFNVNLAPVLDLAYPQNPALGIRSLGQNKHKVADLGCALIRGMQEHGMFAAAKHFPGKGLARQDSHLALPVIRDPKKRILQTETYPFRRAIEQGVAFLMSSHAVYDSLDSKNPGTLSRAILQGLAREQLEFQGIILSDDLEMAAIQKAMKVQEAALKFLQAGGDQLLVCHTPEIQEKVFSRLLRAVQEKKISEKEINLKLQRIGLMKQRWSSQSVVRSNNKAISKDIPLKIARASITLVKNEGNLLPLRLDPQDRLHVFCADYAALTQVEEQAKETDVLLSLLRQYHASSQVFLVPVNPLGFEPFLKAAKEADLNLIFTYNSHGHPNQRELVKKILSVNKPAALCALRNPADLQDFPRARLALATYGWRSCSLQAAVEVLFGKIPACGQLPVELK